VSPAEKDPRRPAAESEYAHKLPTQAEDFSGWYTTLVRSAQLADYAPVKGCMVIRPYGYALWENMQRLLDARIKATGHQNAYFPLLIPESFLKQEAEHVEGFAPQVAWVTQGGEDALEERLAIRPTSEAIICHFYARWIESYRDLPVLINQWANVMRWEKVTRLFLRTTEFLWQEGHTAHRTAEEAMEETLRMLEVYRAFLEEDLGVPVHKGQKSESEKFAGAERTYSVEALMRDGKGLQAGTSHYLGQHFAKVFDITYQDEQGQRQHVEQTSWGVSTRLVGALIMTHGDDAGLRLPPRVAPIQVVVVPIYRKPEERAAVTAFVERVTAGLTAAGVRWKVDADDTQSPGFKFNEWERRGVPVRFEVGPRDVQGEQVFAARRDRREKTPIPLAELGPRTLALLDDVQRGLFEQALAFRDASTADAETLDELAAVLEERRGFVRARWCGEAACETRVKERTTATLRCLPLADGPDPGPCAVCGRPAPRRALFAKAY
jgi:prolyl-tRNA synthetase